MGVANSLRLRFMAKKRRASSLQQPITTPKQSILLRNMCISSPMQWFGDARPLLFGPPSAYWNCRDVLKVHDHALL